MSRTCEHPCRICAKPVRTREQREVIAGIAAYFEIPVERLTNMEWRDKLTTAARHVAAWILLEQFPDTDHATISRLLGFREKSGASHAATSVERRLRTDFRLARDIDTVRQSVIESAA